MTQKLTPRQQRFVDEYLTDLNATQAYQRAGYKAKTNDVARTCASELLANPNVAHAVAQRKAEIAQRLDIDAEWVLRRLIQVAERSMVAEAVLDRDGLPTGDYVFDSRGANRALELIGKHVGFFPKEEKAGDTTNIGNQQINITVQYDYQDPRQGH